MDSEDVLDDVLASRRIPHGRSRNKQGGGGKAKGKGGNGGKGSHAARFDPLRALGHYEVQLGSRNKRPRQQRSDDEESSSSMWVEIHELTEDEDGLVGTLNLSASAGGISGMFVLAGSRKGLQGIVESLEVVDDEDEEDDQVDEEGADDDDNGSDDDNGESDTDEHTDEKTEIELSDEKLNRRFLAFEKNSFRNPKFWMRWKGHVHVHVQTTNTNTRRSSSDNNNISVQTSETKEEEEEEDTTVSDGSARSESDMGYLVFASNNCDSFEGTVTCPTLGWENLKLHGWKTRAKGTPCPVEWTDF